MEKLKIGLEIINKISEASYEAYIVGGAVRDYLLGKPILDIDITTNAKPQDLLNIFENVNLEDEAYLSAKITYKSYVFEVTTFRKDVSYLDHRHPNIEMVQTLKEDLARRDFTMNAMAIDKDFKIIDVYQGQEDMRRKEIKMIGDPRCRFEEDALRVLRAVEFSSRLNFTLENRILESFAYDYLKVLSEEYVVAMLDKILHNPYCIGKKYIVEYKLFRSFPFYQVVCEECFRLQYFAKPYALFYSIHNFLPSQIKLSNKGIKEAKDIAYYVRNNFSNESLFYGNIEYLKNAIDIYNVLHKSAILEEAIQERYQNLLIHSVKEIKMDLQRFPADKRGFIQKELVKRILSGEVTNNKQELDNLIEQGNIL